MRVILGKEGCFDFVFMNDNMVKILSFCMVFKWKVFLRIFVVFLFFNFIVFVLKFNDFGC